MRVAVVDIGTNSTRLLVADVVDGTVTEVERRTKVTRLGQGVDTSGRLADEAIARVHETLDHYAEAIEAHEADARIAVLTSAVRDASNGAEFMQAISSRYGLEASTIGGQEEARLTFAGATSTRAHGDEPVVVIDIGGGSTELVIGSEGEVRSAKSLQLGVVRFTERHLHSDPPATQELQALADDARTAIDAGVTASERDPVASAIAVAGTATSLAAIDLALDPYDPTRVDGHMLPLGTCELLLARLAATTHEERRKVTGLDPERAPTIVAGVIILVEALRAFGLDAVEVSEHDILHGAALDHAANA